jgi:hypothetical protein
MYVSTARQEAGWAFKEADRGRHLRDADCQGYELFFSFHLPKRGGRRPDLQNMPATQKAAIDGIADALGVDDAVFTVHWPTEWSEPIKGGSVVVQIAPSRLATAAERGV